MNINIVTIGKLKERYLQEGVGEYVKRLAPYVKLSIVELKEAIDDNVDTEGEEILKKLGAKDYVVALNVKSKEKSSEEFSRKIETLGIDGISDITFVIGGSNGLSNKVLERANEELSFSKMTFTHQMTRLILIEQIYRAFKIMKNEPYHK